MVFLAISSKEFEDATYFDQLIKDHFYSENRSLPSDGLSLCQRELLYRKGEKEAGLEKDGSGHSGSIHP